MIWLILYAFLLCVLAHISVRGSLAKSKQGMNEYFFVNNRQSSAGQVAFSITASCIGGSATLGMAGLAWQVGTPAFWWIGAGALGLCVLAFFLARMVRQSGAYTLPEMITTFLGAPARPLASIIIVLAWLAITAAQLSAMATLILPLMQSSIESVPLSLGAVLQSFDVFTIALLMGALIVIAYTCIGGQAAIIKSDVVQYILLILSLLVALVLLLLDIYSLGVQNPFNAVQLELVNTDFPLSKLSYFLIILGGSYVVCPMLFGRLYSAKDGATAKRGAILAVFWLILTAVLIVSVGLVCRAYINPDASGMAAEKVLSAVLFEHLPPWANVLCFLGIFSALISSADSSIFTAATICSNDILRQKKLSICRICAIVIGLLAVILALSGKGILQLLLMANDIYVCGVVAPVFVGMILYKRCAFNAYGMSAAIAVGGGFGFVAALSGENIYSYIGITTAILVSLASIKSSPNKFAGSCSKIAETEK